VFILEGCATIGAGAPPGATWDRAVEGSWLDDGGDIH
jgi:hypothetical protein